MSNISLPKEYYNSGDKFENPLSDGHKVYRLHIYPDPKYGNNWVATICGENEELNDVHHIVINKDIMTRRLYSGENSLPYITRDEVIKLLTEILIPYSSEHEIISFSS